MFNFGAIGQGIAGSIEAVVGYRNERRASKLRKKGEKLMDEARAGRTDYEIPQEVLDSYGTAQNEAFGKPAIQRYMEENADRNLANNISAVNRYSTSGADALAAAFSANQQSQADYGQAAAAGSKMRGQNFDRMYDAANTLADYKSMAWDQNVNIPFLQKMQWAQDLYGAGYQGQIDGTNQFVQGNNQIGQSLANFFSMGNTPAAGSGGSSGGKSKGFSAAGAD